jgi:hypothetical protein
MYCVQCHATERTCVKNSPMVFTTKWLHVILHLAQTHYTSSTHKVLITTQNPAVLEKFHIFAFFSAFLSFKALETNEVSVTNQGFQKKNIDNLLYVDGKSAYTVKNPPVGAGPNIQADRQRLIFPSD